jgi:diguanylate cyclase (GGDEF)-like protein
MTNFRDGASESPRRLNFEITTDGETGPSWLRVVAEPIGADFSVTLVDITRRKRDEQKMLADALKDPLTGTLNRRGFEARGRAALQDCDTGAVLYLDLNEFKSINDRFGHDAGDALLKAFGHRLEFCLRPGDALGRLGGDEFAIVMPGVTPQDVRHIAQRLVQTASEPYIIQTQEITCTASVGIALMPKHGDDLWKLLNVADQAMYDAKANVDFEAANDCAAYIESAIAS